MHNYTCHDAICVMKNNTFFAKMKWYEVTSTVYSCELGEYPWKYYVIFRDQDQFFDSAYEINLKTRAATEIDMGVASKIIKEGGLKGYEQKIERVKVKSNV